MMLILLVKFANRLETFYSCATNREPSFMPLQSHGLLCKAEPRVRTILGSAKLGLKPEKRGCCSSSQCWLGSCGFATQFVTP